MNGISLSVDTTGESEDEPTATENTHNHLDAKDLTPQASLGAVDDVARRAES